MRTERFSPDDNVASALSPEDSIPTPSAPEPEGERPTAGQPLDRRAFLGRSALAAGVSGLSLLAQTLKADVGPQSPQDRAKTAMNIRTSMAVKNYQAGTPAHPDNGDEARYPLKWGSYSKGLPHDQYGQVVPSAYQSLMKAMTTGRAADFEAIQMGGSRLLTDPQSALAFDLEGPDSHALAMPPAPALASAETAGEIVENYWMALARDVPFTQYAQDPTIAAACADLSRLSAFKGPKVGGKVTPATVFRGNTAGDLAGPIISQFMWQDIAYGALNISQLTATSLPGKDYMTTFDNWLAVQNGRFSGTTTLPGQRRYISNMRDIGQWVHVDALYEGYLNACLVLLGGNYPLDPGNPYVTSSTQTGFGTFGGPHILSLVCEVATRALKAVWYQKWAVHRRLRPEAYAGLVHLKMSGAYTRLPLHADVLNSDAIAGGRVYNHNQANNKKYYNTNSGSFLLPMAFSEGCPTHPSYGAGHATVAGACVTILKAWFDETAEIVNPVVANADGSELLAYEGPPLTVGEELNKVASNVGVGRNMAGVHWRSDYYQSILLGEAIGIGILQEQKATFNEPFVFTLTRFDGTTIHI